MLTTLANGQRPPTSSWPMPVWLSVLLLVVGVVAVAGVISGVVPAYRTAERRLARAQAFSVDYLALVEGDQTKLPSLLLRSVQMQRDAESVGLGVVYIAPPAMMGGGQYLPHPIFADLLGRQTHSDAFDPHQRLQTLQQVVGELLIRVDESRADLRNPLRWIRLAFERLVGFPRYLLRVAGFSPQVTNSGFARAVTVLWSLVLGAAAIGSFVVGLLLLLRDG